MGGVTRFWSHEASNIRCVRESDFDAAQSELAALREELASANSDKEAYAQNAIDLRKRAVAAEQRNAELVAALERIHFRCESFSEELLGMQKNSVRVMLDIAAKALAKPTESGASE